MIYAYLLSVYQDGHYIGHVCRTVSGAHVISNSTNRCLFFYDDEEVNALVLKFPKSYEFYKEYMYYVPKLQPYPKIRFIPKTAASVQADLDE